MNKTLFCGVDLHSNNAMYVITDQEDRPVLKKRLPNQLPMVLESLEPFRQQLKVVAVESTYNWYWLVDGLMDHGYPVVLAHPSVIDQYDGIKEADDLTDAAFLARLARLNILPTGYIYPREDRPVRDLLRRRTLLVRQRRPAAVGVRIQGEWKSQFRGRSQLSTTGRTTSKTGLKVDEVHSLSMAPPKGFSYSPSM